MTRVRTFPLLAALLGAAVLSSCDMGGPPSYLSTPDARPSASPAADRPGLPFAPAAAATPVIAEPVQPDARPALQPATWGHVPSSLGLPAPRLSASAAVVLDEASGQVLYDFDAHRQLPPASLTKIATAMVVLDSGTGLDSQYTTDVDSELMYNSSVMGLKPGDRFTIRDLLYGLLLPSGNDAALALGRAVAGSDAAFVANMNELAARLGLSDTHFANPHGLSSRNHYSSAYDLAILARYAMANRQFAEIVRTRDYVANGSRQIEVTNVNPFLDYPGADGVKTGYTNRAGKTLVASATRDGHRVYLVLLNAPNREEDAVALMDWVFANYRWSTR